METGNIGVNKENECINFSEMMSVIGGFENYSICVWKMCVNSIYWTMNHIIYECKQHNTARQLLFYNHQNRKFEDTECLW